MRRKRDGRIQKKAAHHTSRISSSGGRRHCDAHGGWRFIGVSSHNRPERCRAVLKDFEIQVMMNAVSFVLRHIYNFEGEIWPEAHRRGIGCDAGRSIS
jgi:hypothetical protein